MTNLASGLSLQLEPPPFRIDGEGVVRIGASRVSLDLIVEQYENGMTPEDVVRAYDSLLLADVYAAVAYYLRRPEEVNAYLQWRASEAKELQGRIDEQRPKTTKEELVARAKSPARRLMLRLASDADVMN